MTDIDVKGEPTDGGPHYGLDARVGQPARQLCGDARGGPSITEQLERLAKLHRRGELTDAEFAAAKQRVLG